MAASDQGPNREELFQMAVQAAKRGQKQPARVMFRRVIGEDPRNIRAMMWMARIAGGSREKRQWLERVIQVDPNNGAAQSALDRMEYETRADRNRTLLRLAVGAWVALVGIGGIVLLTILVR